MEDEVYTVRLDGTDRRLVVDDYRANQVSWSPDGAELLLASDGGVHVVGADGSGLRALGPSDLRVKNAIWSPDGSTIAARDWESLVFIMNRDGTDVRFLAKGIRPFLHRPPDPATCSAGVVVPEPEANPELVEDCRTLVRVWNAFVPTKGSGWDWDAEKPIAEWSGVEVYGDPPRVRGLTLPRDMLTFIPAALGSLTTLEKLVLRRSELTGGIPPELGNLTLLETLNLSDNDLTGPIPPELGDLTILETPHLTENSLTGPILPELGNLGRLETGYLSGNYLTGCIPPSGPIQGVFQVERKLERCKPEGEDGS